MSVLHFRNQRKTPVILQSEAAECGLACLAMIAGFYGRHTDLSSLRTNHAISQQGSTLQNLIHIATRMHLSPRPVQAALESLPELHLPAILHWDFNHFVVLTEINAQQACILDPACGKKLLSLGQLSAHYTGIALELAPTHQFQQARPKPRLKLFELIKSLPGIKKSLLYIFMLAFALQIFSIITPFFMQLVVDHAIISEDYDLLAVLGIGFLLLTLIQVCVTTLRAWVVMVLSTTLDLYMQSNLFVHLLRLPVTFFKKRHLGDLISRFESLNNIQNTFTSGFIECMIDGMMVILTLAVMFFYDARLTAIVLLAALFYGVIRSTLFQALRRASEEHIVYGAKQQSDFLETLRGIQSIKLFNQEANRNARYNNLMVDNYNAGIRVQKLNILFRTLNGLLFGVENILIIWLGGLAVINGSFSVGMLFAFMAYKRQFITRIQTLIDKSVEFKMLGLHLERISDIALEPPEPDQQGLNHPKAFSVAVQNLSFRYSSQSPWLLHKLSFALEEGGSLAITGASGCGKTTLIKMLLGLEFPDQGEILIGGVPLAKIDKQAYRNRVASVMQEDKLFAGSILENITFFSPEPDRERVQVCADMAAIHHEIEAMPMAYNTLIGDMGAVLSSGQQQRVLLARALYKQPKILYLDEATSHLDVVNEKKINEALHKLKITRIIIAHRPQTIASAEQVLQLNAPQPEPALIASA